MKKVLALITAAVAALKESGATGARAESIESHLKSCASNAAAEIKENPEPAAAPKPEEKEKAKGAFGLLQVMILVAVLSLFALCAVKAHADSFRPTNIVNVSVSMVSYPTNAPATNGLNQSTGGAIDVKNCEWAGFYMSGYCTAASILNVTLINSTGENPTFYSSFDSTGTNGIALNWSTNSQMVLSATVPVGPFNWYTNLDRAFIGGSSWVGCYILTNAIASGATTNFDCGLRKKIIPIRFP